MPILIYIKSNSDLQNGRSIITIFLQYLQRQNCAKTLYLLVKNRNSTRLGNNLIKILLQATKMHRINTHSTGFQKSSIRYNASSSATND